MAEPTSILDSLGAWLGWIVAAATAIGALGWKGWAWLRGARKDARKDDEEVVEGRLAFRDRQIEALEKRFDEAMAIEHKRCDDQIAELTKGFTAQLSHLEARLQVVESHRRNIEDQLTEALERIAELRRKIAAMP